MKLEKKHYVIAGVISVATSIAVGAAYLQYKKMMNYVLKLSSLKSKKISKDLISFDVFLNFTNKSSIDMVIAKTISNVYLNDKFVTKIEGLSPIQIKSEATSKIALNVEFNPVKVVDTVGAKLSDILLNPSKIEIRIDLSLKAKLWFFTVPIKQTFKFTLKEILDSNKTPKAE